MHLIYNDSFIAYKDIKDICCVSKFVCLRIAFEIITARDIK